jgi:predicted TIM-barrel fold metal-dependent hydrolase
MTSYTTPVPIPPESNNYFSDGLLDEQRIDAAILYPTIAILWEEECTDPELSAAYCRAYNNYLFDFCGKHPDHLVPVAQVNLRDVNRRRRGRC